MYAGRIVKIFGEQTLNILDNNPDRLSEVPGIGAKRIEKIKKSRAEQREIKNIMVFPQSHDISTSLAARIHKSQGSTLKPSRYRAMWQLYNYDERKNYTRKKENNVSFQ